MFPAGKRAQRLSLVKHSKKKISRHHHHHHHYHHHIYASIRNGDGRIFNFVTLKQFLLGLSFIFADGGEWSVTKLVIFCGRYKFMIP